MLPDRAEPCVRVRQLTKQIGDQCVLRELSFTIPHGDRVTLFAPSGAGKTTLINILSRLDHDYQGDVAVHARQPATIFQEPRLFPYLTVADNIFLPLVVRKTRIDEALRAEYQAWLAVCDLSRYTQHYPWQLSGGMKQKVAIVRGFLTTPDFVMLDEPFKSIDIASKQAIIRHIRRAYPRTTLLLVTHNLDEIPLLTNALLLFDTMQLGAYTSFTALDEREPAALLAEILATLNRPPPE